MSEISRKFRQIRGPSGARCVLRGVEQVPWLYDLGMWLLDRAGLGRWRRWLASGAGGRVLEVGCGTGRNLGLYAPEARVVGLDVNLSSLQRARRRAPGALLVRASAQALPFRDGAFDTVVTSLVLCSVPSPSGAVGEAGRVLKAGGDWRAMEHVRHASGPGAWWQDRFARAWCWFTGGCRWNRVLEPVVASSGFEIVDGTWRAQGIMRRFVARWRREGTP